MKLAVIIPAAGASSRYTQAGGLRSKLDEDLGGKPVIQRTIELFTKFDDADVTISSIVVAGPHADEAFDEFRRQHGDRLALLGAQLCQGGKTHRWETVQSALSFVPSDCTHVAVHDAARPCASFELLGRVFMAAKTHGAAVPVLAISDTIKRITQTDRPAAAPDPLAAIFGDSTASNAPLRVVTGTVDRTGLALVQTPQVFALPLLKAAYAQPDKSSTDDASLVERLLASQGSFQVPNHPPIDAVVAVDGDARNLKITLPGDVELARAIMGLRPPETRSAHKRF